LFYNEAKDVNKESTDEFFKDVETEVVASEGQDVVDRMQRNKLGTLVIYMAAGLSLMVLIPNPLWGRVVFLCCAAAIFVVGYALKKSARVDESTTAGVKVIQN
jgi:hypothetical protein